MFSLLLLFATINSTYCVYEAHKWGGVQGISFGDSSRMRAESIRMDALANSQTMIDVQVFLEWVNAKKSNDTVRADFLKNRFREEFRPAFEAWGNQPEVLNPGDFPPGTPFGFSQYQPESRKAAIQLADEASAAFDQGRVANAIGDSYILNTVFFAIVLFLAGFGTKWRSRKLQFLFLITGIVIATFAFGVLLTLPRVWAMGYPFRNFYWFRVRNPLFMWKRALCGLLLATFVAVFFVAHVAAEDCGCGLSDVGPPDGWDSPGSFTGGGGDTSPADSGGAEDNAGDSSPGSGSSDSSQGYSDSYGDTSGDYSGESAVYSPPASGGSVYDAVTWAQKGLDYYQQGMYNESLRAYNSSLRIDPYAKKAWSGKGDVLARIGDNAGALVAFKKVTILDPSDAEAWFRIGYAYSEEGDYNASVDAYTRALAINPHYSEAERNRTLVMGLLQGSAVTMANPGMDKDEVVIAVDTEPVTPVMTDGTPGNPVPTTPVKSPVLGPLMMPGLIFVMSVFLYGHRNVR
jgi:tetratricopeptide (TPR) repeat protein